MTEEKEKVIEIKWRKLIPFGIGGLLGLAFVIWFVF